MAIQLQCDACFFSFSVKDEHAGKKGKCPECGTAVNVPARSGGARSSRSSAAMPAAPPASRSGKTARPAPKRPSGSNVGLIVGLGGGGAVLLIALIVFLVIRAGNSGNASPNTPAGNQVAAAGNPAAASLPATTPGATTPAAAPGAAVPAATAPGTATPAAVPPGTTPGATVPAATTPGTTIPAAIPPGTTGTAPSTTPGATSSAAVSNPTTPGASGSSATPSADSLQPYASVPDLIDAVKPSCCRIEVKTAEGGGLGSGFVVDKAGIVVTNYHVIEGGAEATVVFPDESTGKVTGFLALEPKLDLAVLKIEYPADKLHPVRIASKDPRDGEDVVAIGSPLGLSFTNTRGTVSAVRKEAEMKMYVPDLEGVWIQTSTPISGGNSGGPLFNMKGEVIAANTMSIVAANAQNLNFGTSYQNIRKALDKKSDQLIAMSPKSAPKRRASSSGGRDTFADETKTVNGKKLLGEIKELAIQEINISFDRTGEVTAYVRNIAEKAWKQAGVEIVSPPAPAFMLIVMRFKKGTGRASNSILEIQAQIYVGDQQARRVAKVWSDTEEVGTISESALAVGNVPESMKKKILSYFNKVRSAYKLAGVESKKEEEKQKDEDKKKESEKPKEQGKTSEEKKDEGKK